MDHCDHYASPYNLRKENNMPSTDEPTKPSIIISVQRCHLLTQRRLMWPITTAPAIAASVVATMPIIAIMIATIMLASCGGATIKHGHLFRPSDLTQVREGMSKDQVTQILGTPDTTSPVGGGEGYYYISSVEKQTSFMKPDQIDRKIVAVYFNKLESVDKIAHYGLKDGKVFDFISRTTGTHARDESILKALFRNLGKKQGIF